MYLYCILPQSFGCDSVTCDRAFAVRLLILQHCVKNYIHQQYYITTYAHYRFCEIKVK